MKTSYMEKIYSCKFANYVLTDYQRAKLKYADTKHERNSAKKSATRNIKFRLCFACLNGKLTMVSVVLLKTIRMNRHVAFPDFARILVFENFLILQGPIQHLLVQSHQWKHQNNVWNIFKVDNKETKTNVNDPFLVSLLVSLKLFHTLLLTTVGGVSWYLWLNVKTRNF